MNDMDCLEALFDNIIDTPEKDSENFKNLCLKNGDSILALARKIDYPRYDAFSKVYHTKSMEFLLADLKQRKKTPADHVFGCRDPSTEAGSWNKAYVYAKQGDQQVGAVFEDQKDYISHPTLEDALQQYQNFIRQGWTPMAPEDIRATSGIVVGEETNLNPGS